MQFGIKAKSSMAILWLYIIDYRALILLKTHAFPCFVTFITYALQWLHMSTKSSKIFGNSIICSTACSDSHYTKYQGSAILAIMQKGICHGYGFIHYSKVIMGAIASQITSLTIVYLIVHSDADQRKHQSSVSLAFVCGEFTGDRWIPRTNGQ